MFQYWFLMPLSVDDIWRPIVSDIATHSSLAECKYKESSLLDGVIWLAFANVKLVWLLTDAPVHPPVSETHPYDNQDPKTMPADTEYGCQMVDGVVHVYTKKNNMDKCVFVPFSC